MTLRSLVVPFVVLAVGCATPYQANGLRGGYEDYRAGAGGAVMVTFRGNGYSSEGYVTRMWHRRAAEVCGGPEQYEVLDSAIDSDTTAIGNATSTTDIAFHGNQATATTTHHEPTQITKHELRGLVRCVNGGKYDPSRKLPE